MGWSCSADAAHVTDAWTRHCLTQQRTDGERNTQNGYIGKDGRKYFWDTSRKEHDDGAITGTTWRYLPDGEHIRQCGSFRINWNGSVKTYPTSWPFPKTENDFLKQIDAEVKAFLATFHESPDPDVCLTCKTVAERGDKYCAQCGTRLSTIDAETLFMAEW